MIIEEKIELECAINRVIENAFKRIEYAYRHHCEGSETDYVPKPLGDEEIESKLVFPMYSDEEERVADNKQGSSIKTRISEQELRFAFVEAFTEPSFIKSHNLYYSIETPTKSKYANFSSKAIDDPIVKDDSEKGGKSGEFDLVVLKNENNRLERACYIEFKAKNTTPRNYWKDFLKMNNEGHGALCIFINILDTCKQETIKSIIGKISRFYNNDAYAKYIKEDRVIIYLYSMKGPIKQIIMTNLPRESTGVEPIIWVCHKWSALNTDFPEPFILAWTDINLALITIQDEPKVRNHDKLYDGDKLLDVIKWIRLNKEVLLAYWSDDLYPTSKMLSEIKKLGHNLS